jgi:hypothetical protein
VDNESKNDIPHQNTLKLMGVLYGDINGNSTLDIPEVYVLPKWEEPVPIFYSRCINFEIEPF